MAGKPRSEAEATFAGMRLVLKGSFPFDPAVRRVLVARMVVPQRLYRLVDGQGDDYLRDVAVLGGVHLQLAGGGPPLPPLLVR